VRFFSASQVDFSYASTIPMQLDGEITWLGPSDFPVTMSVLQPAIQVLRP
jgi:diacylglycerol kinase family enzyme